MLVKVSEATRLQLDFMVATALGLDERDYVVVDNLYGPQWRGPKYTTDWAEGGPIIEREGITVGPYHGEDCQPTGVFQAYIGWDREEMEPLFQVDGPTPLIATMRCFVVSKLGNEVEVPDELT